MKEIIINGIDVAGCEHHLSTGYCQLQMIFQGMVLQLPFGKHLECNLCDKDCYYKQLKRAEIEIEKLKGVDGSVHPDSAYYKITRLEQENAELKAKNERLKEEIKYLEEEKKEKIQLLEQIINILYPNANDDELFTVTFNSEYIDKLKKIQQTLQEIKAIIKGELPYKTAYLEDAILEKITKAEVGE